MEVKEVARVLDKIFDVSVEENIIKLSDNRLRQLLIVTSGDREEVVKDVGMRVYFGYRGKRYVIIPMYAFGGGKAIPAKGDGYYLVMIEAITPAVTPVRVALEKSGVMRAIDEEVRGLVNIISEVGNRYISLDWGKFDKEVDVMLVTILKPLDPKYNRWIEFTAYEVEYVPMAIILGYLTGGNDYAKAVFIDLLKRRLDNEYMLSTVFNSFSDLVVMAWKRKKVNDDVNEDENDEETIEDVEDLAEEFGLKG